MIVVEGELVARELLRREPAWATSRSSIGVVVALTRPVVIAMSMIHRSCSFSSTDSRATAELATVPPTRTSSVAIVKVSGTPTRTIATSTPSRTPSGHQLVLPAWVAAVDRIRGAEVQRLGQPVLVEVHRNDYRDAPYRLAVIIAERPDRSGADHRHETSRRPDAAVAHADLETRGHDDSESMTALLVTHTRGYQVQGVLGERDPHDSAWVPSMRWPKIQRCPRCLPCPGSARADPGGQYEQEPHGGDAGDDHPVAHGKLAPPRNRSR